MAHGQNTGQARPRATGSGHKNLCTVGGDPQYNGTESALYCVTVLEHPSCRCSLAPTQKPF
ncbi:DUF3604 domain-containing protein [Seongchinamella sediminis]|uniref:DUF3604 domain-containing protein n=1 Tax=Seongchinamella sediminis TaxID=2283635 RepID=A0A3L7E023_9GAMM|nr:DUF3604 domain-containing protein [Seongchinamella sediminis]RLQ21601.1 DUF3604 domain-containing protein [Seongchinamella sediminis]